MLYKSKAIEEGTGIMTEGQSKTKKISGGRSRSPRYPFISLKKAIERAKTLEKNAQHHKVNANVLAESWGYSKKSSSFMQTTATLLQFGLLKDEGGGDKRRFQLTNDALRIVRDADPNSEKCKQKIAKAALKPQIHKELWERFGSSTGDALLQNYLILDRRDEGKSAFSKAAASNLISVYKETITYAQLSEDSESVFPEEGGGGETENEDSEQSVKTSPKTTLSSPHQQPLGHSAFETTQSERVVFKEEVSPQQSLCLLATGELDDYLLETLEDFVKRQRKRLQLIKKTEENRPVDSQTDVDGGDDSDEGQDTAEDPSDTAEDPFLSKEGE